MYQCALSLLHQKQPELSPYVLQERFEDLHQPIPSTLTTISAKKRKNAAANRYSNVLPYDHNCVKVGACGEDVSKRRYINASLLRVRLPPPDAPELLALCRLRVHPGPNPAGPPLGTDAAQCLVPIWLTPAG